jgi:copper chaperone CopZ|tara:strand:- start:99 stop:761 length:663 start_codon:yes stop_codon:yes gene_type:complete
MSETVSLEVGGMTCEGCSNRVKSALESIQGVNSADVSHESGIAIVVHQNISEKILTSSVQKIGYTVDGKGEDFHWKDGSVWKQSAHNTKWCLIGCSIGEFGTLAYYSYSGITSGLELYSKIWYFYAILPLINGLTTSVMLETVILMRGQMDFRNALSTAFGMSFISMLMMEIAMEITDLLFTQGELGLMPLAIPFMLLVGFLTPWPYNYWRLKKYGASCH